MHSNFAMCFGYARKFPGFHYATQWIGERVIQVLCTHAEFDGLYRPNGIPETYLFNSFQNVNVSFTQYSQS